MKPESQGAASLTRRRAIGLGLAGLSGAALGVSLPGIFGTRPDRGGGTEPVGHATRNEELWTLWQKRGWVKEARHYERVGKTVACRLCPNQCVLAPGERGRCRNKINRDGTLYTMAYGNPCTFHVDPVEKKPLYHFLPGTKTFSLATAGCVFRCLNCQNWEISQRSVEETKDPRGDELRLRPPLPEYLTSSQLARASLFPEDVVEVTSALGCPSISYTYTEPIAFYEYTQDCCKLAREHKLRNILVTCGSVNESAARDLYQWVDGAHIDLKGFDDEVYRRLNSGRLQPVLNAIKLAREIGVWVEIVNLIVPTYTDNLETIRKMCGWIVRELGPDVPLHFSRFHPHYKLKHLPPTPVETLLKAREAARSEGIRYVYIGNVPGLEDAGTTLCPNCKKPVAKRDIFAVTQLDIVDGKCKYCGEKIPGVWA
ncbi:MAG: AmmeMemoRadiSam system radical SAM enzyme [Verrucomicrobiae bacterium]|nr:AmmeMemoRadiSam system radical SAM enzyme [Verrucomicrobiae bacterium]